MNVPKMSLHDHRKRLGLTQAQAAWMLGISVETIGNYERGKTYPDVPTIKKIEESYGINYDSIIFLPLDYD